MAAIVAVALSMLACGSKTATPSAPSAPRWAISGTVRDEANVISGATVTLSAYPLPVPVTTTSTDGNGRYSFPSVEQGMYFVGASAPGHAAAILPVTATSTQTVDLVLPLAPR